MGPPQRRRPVRGTGQQRDSDQRVRSERTTAFRDEEVIAEQVTEARRRAESIASVESAVVLGEIAPSVELSESVVLLADDVVRRLDRVGLELEAVPA